MSKTIPFNPIKTEPLPAADKWVGGTEAGREKPEAQGPTRRLTVNIPEELHRRIKVKCAADGRQITDVINELLLREYPAE